MSGECKTDANEPNLFGIRLKAARGERSARSVAKEAAVSAVYYLALEKGINRKTGKPSRPSEEVVLRLSETLQTDKEELLALAGYDLSSRRGSKRFGGSVEGMARGVVTGFKAISQLSLENAAELVKTGRVDSVHMQPVLAELQYAEAYKQAAVEIEETLERLNQKIGAISASHRLKNP